MRCTKKSLAILLCLFLISFKVTAGSIFIDSALERAQMQQNSSACNFNQNTHIEKAEGRYSSGHQTHTLFLMNHVVGSLSASDVTISFVPTQIAVFFLPSNILRSQNFPDSDFKPPKLTT